MLTIEDPAFQIARHVVEGCGAALMAADYEAFDRFQFIPQIIETVDYRQSVESRAELRAVFTSVRKLLAAEGITFLDRRITDAKLTPEGRVEVVYHTDRYRRETLIQPSHQSFLILAQDQDLCWKITYAMYVALENRAFNEALVSVAPVNPLIPADWAPATV